MRVTDAAQGMDWEGKGLGRVGIRGTQGSEEGECFL
jgi:hypothetical protein